MRRENGDRVLLWSFAASVLKHLEDERILFFDLPHFVEEVCSWRARAVLAPTSDTTSYVRSDAICQRQLNVLRKVSQRTKFKHIKGRFVFVIGMRGCVEPGVTDIVTQREHQRLTTLPNHCRVERKTSQLRNEVRESWFEEWSPWSVLGNDIFVNLSYYRADDVFRRLVVILHPRQHLQIAYYQSFLHVVGQLAFPQSFVRPDIDRPHFVRSWAYVTASEHTHERQERFANVDGIHARVAQARQNVAGELGHQNRFASARGGDDLN